MCWYILSQTPFLTCCVLHQCVWYISDSVLNLLCISSMCWYNSDSVLNLLCISSMCLIYLGIRSQLMCIYLINVLIYLISDSVLNLLCISSMCLVYLGLRSQLAVFVLFLSYFRAFNSSFQNDGLAVHYLLWTSVIIIILLLFLCYLLFPFRDHKCKKWDKCLVTLEVK